MTTGEDMKALAQLLRTCSGSVERTLSPIAGEAMREAADALDRLAFVTPGTFSEDDLRRAFQAGFAARPGDECDGRTTPFRWEFSPGGIAWDRVDEAYRAYRDPLPTGASTTPSEAQS